MAFGVCRDLVPPRYSFSVVGLLHLKVRYIYKLPSEALLELLTGACLDRNA